MIAEYYNSFFRALGPQRRRMGKTPVEVIAAAHFRKSTAWTNGEQASNHLRSNEMLTSRAIELFARGRFFELMSPSGYFRQKTKNLKAFVEFLRRDFRGARLSMLRTPTEEARGRKLEAHGIGSETADLVLFHAGGHPVFVVDAHTKRNLVRRGWTGE